MERQALERWGKFLIGRAIPPENLLRCSRRHLHAGTGATHPDRSGK
jgi:hypothetical protein